LGGGWEKSGGGRCRGEVVRCNGGAWGGVAGCRGVELSGVGGAEV